MDYGELGVSARKADDLAARMRALGVSEDDLDEKFVRGSGRGGQKVNRAMNAVQLTHRATGRKVTSHADRSRARNRFFARRRLVELLEAEQLGTQSPDAKRREKIRKQKARRRRRSTSSRGGESS